MAREVLHVSVWKKCLRPQSRTSCACWAGELLSSGNSRTVTIREWTTRETLHLVLQETGMEKTGSEVCLGSKEASKSTSNPCQQPPLSLKSDGRCGTSRTRSACPAPCLHPGLRRYGFSGPGPRGAEQRTPKELHGSAKGPLRTRGRMK